MIDKEIEFELELKPESKGAKFYIEKTILKYNILKINKKYKVIVREIDG